MSEIFMVKIALIDDTFFKDDACCVVLNQQELVSRVTLVHFYFKTKYPRFQSTLASKKKNQKVF